MKTELANFLKSFLSRKFLVSMTAAGTLYANGQVKLAVGAVALWVLAQAAIDFKAVAPLVKEAEVAVAAATGAPLPPPPPPAA